MGGGIWSLIHFIIIATGKFKDAEKIKMFNDVKTYITSNVIMFTIAVYFVFSAVLKVLTGIDICIPCIWKTLFDVHCFGCGLTTAFVSLLELDIKKAFESNWLIFIIIPSGFYYLIQEFKKHRKNTAVNKENH